MSSDSSSASPQSSANGLGDLVAAAFASVGITKDRAQAVAELAGFEDCGCAQRQERLNDLGRMVGIGGPPPAADSPPTVG
jgi:hypothetical protein